MTDGNFFHEVIMGPIMSDRKNNASSIAAFHTTGPIAMIAIRMSGLGFCLPLRSGNDFTNMYATMKIVD